MSTYEFIPGNPGEITRNDWGQQEAVPYTDAQTEAWRRMTERITGQLPEVRDTDADNYEEVTNG